MATNQRRLPNCNEEETLRRYLRAHWAGEYAPLACNPYRGCGNACGYCWVVLMRFLKLTRKEFDAGAVPKKDFLKRLETAARKYQKRGSTEQILLCFTSDLYNPHNTLLTRPTLEILIAHGLPFCGLTKGGTRALVDADLYRPTRDAFASTMTSLDDDFSLKWERRAALPGDRIAAQALPTESTAIPKLSSS
jgi:DNA repair photolyase